MCVNLNHIIMTRKIFRLILKIKMTFLKHRETYAVFSDFNNKLQVNFTNTMRKYKLYKVKSNCLHIN